MHVTYHVGSNRETAGKSGFAHFFEHLLFEGSENIGRGEYMKMVQENGGVLNANTSFDRTFYYEILPSNQLELALWMESERMLHAKIDQIGVDTQREVVKEELRERWRLQLKYATLGTYDSKMRQMEKSDESEDEDEATAAPLTPEEAEKSSRASTKKTLDEFFDFVDDLERKDWFVQYINTIVDEFDPHTFYFAPDDKEKFDMSMSGKFEGIGARLQKKPEGAKIVDIISGGPVWRDGQLEVGDQILKVGQKGEISRFRHFFRKSQKSQKYHAFDMAGKHFAKSTGFQVLNASEDDRKRFEAEREKSFVLNTKSSESREMLKK